MNLAQKLSIIFTCLGLLARLAKVEAALLEEKQKRIADLESLGTVIESQLRVLPEALRARKV